MHAGRQSGISKCGISDKEIQEQPENGIGRCFVRKRRNTCIFCILNMKKYENKKEIMKKEYIE